MDHFLQLKSAHDAGEIDDDTWLERVGEMIAEQRRLTEETRTQLITDNQRLDELSAQTRASRRQQPRPELPELIELRQAVEQLRTGTFTRRQQRRSASTELTQLRQEVEQLRTVNELLTARNTALERQLADQQ